MATVVLRNVKKRGAKKSSCSFYLVLYPHGRDHFTEVLLLQQNWNERQQRFWCASEALSLGHGGVSVVSRATGFSRRTIAQGIRELKNNEHLSGNRVRREGGGRKKVTETQPDLLSSLDALVEPTAKGDPMSPPRWTTKSTCRLCQVLTEQGFSISPMQVSHLLHELDYQLSANRKSLEGTVSERNGIVYNGGWRREQW